MTNTPDQEPRRRPTADEIHDKLETLAYDTHCLRCMSIITEESVTHSHFGTHVAKQDGMLNVKLTHEERDVLAFCLGEIHRRALAIDRAVDAIVALSFDHGRADDRIPS